VAEQLTIKIEEFQKLNSTFPTDINSINEKLELNSWNATLLIKLNTRQLTMTMNLKRICFSMSEEIMTKTIENGSKYYRQQLSFHGVLSTSH
jgi:hypothetical protein